MLSGVQRLTLLDDEFVRAQDSATNASLCIASVHCFIQLADLEYMALSSCSEMEIVASRKPSWWLLV